MCRVPRLTVVTMSAVSIARRTILRRPIQVSAPWVCTQKRAPASRATIHASGAMYT
jgi:hypothetical protein